MHALIELPAETPEAVRMREGFNAKGCWYRPIQERPRAFRQMHGNPATEWGLREG